MLRCYRNWPILTNNCYLSSTSIRYTFFNSRHSFHLEDQDQIRWTFIRSSWTESPELSAWLYPSHHVHRHLQSGRKPFCLESHIILSFSCTIIRREIRLCKSGSTWYKSVRQWILTGCHNPLNILTWLYLIGYQVGCDSRSKCNV